MGRFLDGEGKAWPLMVQNRSRDAKGRLGPQDACAPEARAHRLDLEPALEGELGRTEAEIRRDLRHDEDEVGRIAVDQVPAIGGELVIDLGTLLSGQNANNSNWLVSCEELGLGSSMARA